MCRNTVLYLLFLFISPVTCYDVTNSIDFEGSGCNTQLMVGDNTIAEVIATPQAGVLPDSSKCEAKFQAIPADRKLKIYIQDFFMGPGACGHKLKIYDGVEFVSQDPKWEFSCNTEIQDVYTSSTNQVIIAFTKPSVDTSQLYRFKIHLTTDRAAPLTGGAGGDGGGGGITSGAIAGIAVGCVVGVVIIIAICIYLLWKFMRQAEEKKRYVAEPPPAISVISAPPLSNCGIAPGSSRRSFRSQSHVAFSTVSKKGDTSDSLSKSRSQKSFDNHGFSQDGTSVSSSHTRTENSKDDQGASNKNYKSEYKEDLKRSDNLRRSTAKDRKEEKINYPDVVDSARKSEKNRQTRSYDDDDFRNTKSRSDSVRRTEKEKEKSRHRSDSMKKGDFRERSESAGRDKERDMYRLQKPRDDNDYNSDERDRERYYERKERPQKHEKNQNDRHQKYRQSDKYKTESVYTDDSGATYISSVSDRYHERSNRRNRQTDKQENRRYPNDRKHRDDRRNEHRHHEEQYDDRRYGDDRNYRDRYSERSSSQRRGRSDIQSRKNHDFEERESDRRRSRREESGRQRSHSTSHQEKYADYDRNRDKDQRSHYEDERNPGLRRRESSRSQSGRHRSRSSYR
ncbi:splicing regulatory glutamine/lysine-rich protein 1-like isoform X2 [Mytilus californianus]|uniref:splicing regulatory glutamine/lysine-rich protein 1-like isoform X2 n=1 Tax=Mytilus californianus TaxID=6549 RepID=UPI002245FAAD|nr:splicing regulatory glutamine/lysine-rich protein 1-like isoform X2 [Mytilus californianus]